MHKLILKLFKFLKNSAYFIKIVAVFLILMLLLHWIDHLAGYSWNWLGFVDPLFTELLRLGAKITNHSFNLFAARFEVKYFIALLILYAFYGLGHFIELGFIALEDAYKAGRMFVRKIEENIFNKTLETQNTLEQSNIKRYQIYVGTSVKPKYAHKEYNVNLEEQNQIMNKFLISKTGACPQRYEKGFLYTFDAFSKIDGILDSFNKLLVSNAPIDYIICVQILDNDPELEMQQIKALIGLEHLNKITTFSDTAYRYTFNSNQKYETSQLGIFQQEFGTKEVHQFIKKD